jgi:hypothetical protein
MATMLAFLLAMGWVQAGPLDLPTTPTATLTVTVDDTPLTVQSYRVVYVANPVQVMNDPTNPSLGFTTDYQAMNIYVPENATASSPIILQDGNSGWQGNKVATPVVANGVCLTTGSTTGTTACAQKTAVALKAGYVIVSFGIRSRGQSGKEGKDMAGNYIGHAPAQTVDTKAAIRYLRYNAAAIAGDTNRMIITGTSGGGGQGVATAASGNSPDFYPYLYKIGAAGITYDSQSGTYSSTINDDLFGTVLYCPITDLDHADGAYDWMYGQTRTELNVYAPGTYSTAQLAASDFLKTNYATYFNGLDLKDQNGNLLTANNLGDALKGILEKEIREACAEVGPTQMYTDTHGTLAYKDDSWYTVTADCSAATIDLDKYLYFIARNQTLKNPPAFDNYQTELSYSQNESNLSGTATQPYSHFAEWSWDHNAGAVTGVGLNNTGLTWQQFILTDAGKAVLQQMKMINPMPYLTGDAANADSAPYWYYRHGMRDRDTAFPVPVALYYAALSNSDVSNVNFELTWLKTHSGDYDVPEAYEWVAEAVDNAKYFDAIERAIPAGDVASSFTLPTGDATNKITYSSSNQSVFNVVNGQAIVTQPAKIDAHVTLRVEVASDKISLTGYNYGTVDVTHAYSFTVPALSKDQCKDGGWQRLFRTNGTGFKNQGDCIQYANTGK